MLVTFRLVIQSPVPTYVYAYLHYRQNSQEKRTGNPQTFVPLATTIATRPTFKMCASEDCKQKERRDASNSYTPLPNMLSFVDRRLLVRPSVFVVAVSNSNSFPKIGRLQLPPTLIPSIPSPWETIHHQRVKMGNPCL